MKRQHLFNSFWPITVAVLATQPARADVVQVNEVRFSRTASGVEVLLETSKERPKSAMPKSATPPVISIFSDGNKLVAEIANTQLRDPQGATFQASLPTDGITAVTVKPLNTNSIRVTVTGTTDVHVGKLVKSDRGLVLLLAASSNPYQGRSTGSTNQHSSSKLTPKKTPRSSEPLAKQPTLPKSEPVVVALSNATKQPTPTTIPSNIPPGSVGNQGTPAPSYLNQSPNPLQFPTRPEEVRIQGTQPITLEQAIELARRNTRTIQIAELNLRSSRAVLREAQASEYPQLTLGATFGHSDIGFINSSNASIGAVGVTGASGTNIGTGTTGTTGTTTAAGTTGTITNSNTTATPVTATGNPNTTGTTSVTGSTGTTSSTGTTGTTGTTGSTSSTGTTARTGSIATTGSTNLTGTLTLSYDLYTSGRRDATIREAERQVRSSELALEDQIEQLRLDVSNDYYALQQADQQVLIDLAAVTNAQANLRDTQALERAGVGTRFDVLTSQVQLANTTSNLTNAQAQQQISRRQLAQLLSLSQSIEISAADPVQIAGFWDLSLESSIVQAFKNRADLEAQLVQREINIQQRRADLATLGPQVSLSAAYSLSDQLNNGLSSAGTSDGYSLQATASLLLFDGGQIRAKAAQDEANIAIAETNFANTRDQIRFAVEQAYAQLQSNAANIQTTTLALEESREALRLARLRFQAGVGTQTDVISSENNLTLAEGNRVTAILNYNRALATIRRSVSNVRSR